jgi:hypothetical protein
MFYLAVAGKLFSEEKGQDIVTICRARAAFGSSEWRERVWARVAGRVLYTFGGTTDFRFF